MMVNYPAALQEWMPTLLALGGGCAYITYYFMSVVNVPVVACGNDKFKRFLKTHVQCLHKPYRPPFWCFESHIHTLIAIPARSFITIDYRRELLATTDGGEIGLDWLNGDDVSKYPRKSRPTVLILPGITGSSEDKYVQHLSDDVHRLGYRSVVFNQRGFGGTKLKTPRVCCATNTEDFRLVVEHIQSEYPDAPILAVGMSMGGIILMNYLAECGEECGLVAAVSLSAAWDMHKSTQSIEYPLNWFLFNRFLAKGLVANVERNIEVFKGQYDVKSILQSKTIKEFDARTTAKIFGYESVDQYYTDATLTNKLDQVKIPTLCLNAADDPMTPLETLPLTAARKASSVAFFVTSHGGHLGFMEGTFPFNKSLMDHVVSQYVDSIFNYADELH